MAKDDPFSIEITPELIIRAYCSGVFPMAEDADTQDIFWVSPEERGILPLDEFITSRSLRKTLKKHKFSVFVDRDFDAVIQGCATAGTDREATWINGTIRLVYAELFKRGVCHTVEVWDEDVLVGGLYGLAIGSAFFGESMFHRKTDASKIALAHLVERLNVGGFTLLDTQFITPHLESMGGIEIPKEVYDAKLDAALKLPADFYAFDASDQQI